MPHYNYASLFFALLLIMGLPRHAESMGPNDDPLRLNLDQRPADQAETVYGFRMQAAAGSAGETPFWLHSNRYGELERFSNNASLHLFGRTSRRIHPNWRLSGGADFMLRESADGSLHFQEAWLRVQYRFLMLTVGRKAQPLGLLQPELTTGSVDRSRNARPMPKITLATDGFRPVPGTSRVFRYHASLSHGWMDDDDFRFVDGVLLHEKYLYLRLFADDAPVVPRAGLIHFAQWGGDSPVHGQAPQNLKAWRDVFFSMASDSREILEGGELANRFQNHVGAYDFSLMLNLGLYRVIMNRQFILEDTPNARFGTPLDGLWGLTLERRPDGRTSWLRDLSSSRYDGFRPLLRAVHYEHLNTRDGLNRYSHRDETNYFNYYNHSSFRGGWTYEGRVIGNPLFFSHPDYLGVVNNLLIGHHIGAMGHLGPADWRIFSTYTRNHGASRVAQKEDGARVLRSNERRDQWSFLVEISGPVNEIAGWLTGRRASGRSGGPASAAGAGSAQAGQARQPASGRSPFSALKGLQANLALAYDTGEVYPDQFGVLFGLRWTMR